MGDANAPTSNMACSEGRRSLEGSGEEAGLLPNHPVEGAVGVAASRPDCGDVGVPAEVSGRFSTLALLRLNQVLVFRSGTLISEGVSSVLAGVAGAGTGGGSNGANGSSGFGSPGDVAGRSTFVEPRLPTPVSVLDDCPLILIEGAWRSVWKRPAFAGCVGDPGNPDRSGFLILSSGEETLTTNGRVDGDLCGGLSKKGMTGDGWEVCGGVMGNEGSLISEESTSSARPGGRDGTDICGDAWGSRE